jgi:hypothetical protein
MSQRSSHTHHPYGSKGHALRSARRTGIRSLEAIPTNHRKTILLRRADLRLATSSALSNLVTHEAHQKFSGAPKIPSTEPSRRDVDLLSHPERTTAALLYLAFANVREQLTLGDQSEDATAFDAPIGTCPRIGGR